MFATDFRAEDLDLAIALGEAAERFVETFEEFIGETVALHMDETPLAGGGAVHVVEYRVDGETVARGVDTSHGRAVKAARTAGRQWILDNVFPESAHALRLGLAAIESVTN